MNELLSGLIILGTIFFIAYLVDKLPGPKSIKKDSYSDGFIDGLIVGGDDCSHHHHHSLDSNDYCD